MHLPFHRERDVVFLTKFYRALVFLPPGLICGGHQPDGRVSLTRAEVVEGAPAATLTGKGAIHAHSPTVHAALWQMCNEGAAGTRLSLHQVRAATEGRKTEFQWRWLDRRAAPGSPAAPRATPQQIREELMAVYPDNVVLLPGVGSLPLYPIVNDHLVVVFFEREPASIP